MNISYKDEEHWNTGTHALGILFGIAGLILLLTKSKDLDLIPTISVWIYGISVILLFSASTAYHAVAHPARKRKLRILDHISIYYLIAGTYTPVCILVLMESRGDILLCAVWGMALFGTILKLFFTGKFEIFSLFLYLLMGWLVAIDYAYLVQHISKESFFWLVSGGAFYTLGILFYAIRKIPFNHMIWHLFVLLGAVSHWVFINNLL